MRTLLTLLILLVASQCAAATTEEIAEKCMPSVVRVITFDATGEEIYHGSGFFITPERVVTTAEALDEAYSAWVCDMSKANWERYNQVAVLNINKDMNLAILHVKAGHGAPLQLSPNYNLKLGQHIVAIGYAMQFANTLSEGVIGAISDLGNKQSVQITALISAGSEGGPILNDKGHVVGVVTGKWNDSEIGFAIGIQNLSEFLNQEENRRQLAVGGSRILPPANEYNVEHPRAQLHAATERAQEADTNPTNN